MVRKIAIIIPFRCRSRLTDVRGTATARLSLHRPLRSRAMAASGSDGSAEELHSASGKEAAACDGVVALGLSCVTGSLSPSGAAASAPGEDPLRAQIDALRQEQAELKKKRKKISADLKNAERKRNRLKKRARLLSDVDLVQVVLMRRDAQKRLQNPPSDVAGPAVEAAKAEAVLPQNDAAAL